MSYKDYLLKFMDEDEKWIKDTSTYIKKIMGRLSGDQKKFAQDLLSHLDKKQFLSDEQKKALGNLSKMGGGKGEGDKAKGDTAKGEETEKGKTNGKKDKDKAKDTKKQKAKVSGKNTKAIGSAVGAFLKSVAGKTKDMSKSSLRSLDSKLADTVEKGVEGGKSVADASKEAFKNMKAKLDAEEKERKAKAKEREKEDKAKKKKKNESFSEKFESYLTESRTATGDCFKVHADILMDMRFRNPIDLEKHTLVHGLVDGQGPLEGVRYVHCWLEKGNNVIDRANGKDMEVPKVVYYKIGGVKKNQTVRYTPQEAFKKMVETGIYGTWDKMFDKYP